MPWILYRGGGFPRGSIRFRVGPGSGWTRRGFRFVTVPSDSYHRHNRLDRGDRSEEKRNLASRPALETKIWQSLVSGLPWAAGALLLLNLRQEDGRNELSIPPILVRRRGPDSLLDWNCRGRRLGLARLRFFLDVWTSGSSPFSLRLTLMRSSPVCPIRFLPYSWPCLH